MKVALCFLLSSLTFIKSNCSNKGFLEENVSVQLSRQIREKMEIAFIISFQACKIKFHCHSIFLDGMGEGNLN